jgi:hypothetical protein
MIHAIANSREDMHGRMVLETKYPYTIAKVFRSPRPIFSFALPNTL